MDSIARIWREVGMAIRIHIFRKHATTTIQALSVALELFKRHLSSPAAVNSI